MKAVVVEYSAPTISKPRGYVVGEVSNDHRVRVVIQTERQAGEIYRVLEDGPWTGKVFDTDDIRGILARA